MADNGAISIDDILELGSHPSLEELIQLKPFLKPIGDYTLLHLYCHFVALDCPDPERLKEFVDCLFSTGQRFSEDFLDKFLSFCQCYDEYHSSKNKILHSAISDAIMVMKSDRKLSLEMENSSEKIRLDERFFLDIIATFGARPLVSSEN